MSPSRGPSRASSRGRRSLSSSPRRKPLSERSPSQNNARSLSSRSRQTPSIRIVDDDSWISQSRVYQKSPLPSKPSQIYVPGYIPVGLSRPGSVAGARGSSIASDATSSNEALVPEPLQPRKPVRTSGSTNFSEDDTLVNASSIFFKRQSLSGSTPISPSFPTDSILEKGSASTFEDSEASSRYSTIRPVISSSPPESESGRSIGSDLLKQGSPASTSSESVQTLTPRATVLEDSASANYEVIASSPVRSESVSSYRGLQHASSAKRLPKPIFPPTNNTSTQSLSDLSFISSYISIDEPLQSASPSPNQQSDLRSAIANGRAVDCSTGPRRSSSVSRPSESDAERSLDPPVISFAPHALDDAQHLQVAPQLSSVFAATLPPSLQRVSHSPTHGDHGDDHTTLRSVPSSALAPLPTLSSGASVAMPPPLFQRNGRSYTPDSQELQESDDTVPELSSPHLRTVRSNRSFFSVFSNSESRPSSASESIRGSIYERGSYMESNFFPAWARSYYRRGSTSFPTSESAASLSPPIVYPQSPSSSHFDTALPPKTPPAPSRTPSLDYIPATLYSPRKRARQQQPLQGYRPPTTESVVSFVEPDVQRPLPAVPAPTDPRTGDVTATLRGPRPPPKTRALQRTSSAAPTQRSHVASSVRRTTSGHFTWTPRLARDRRSVGVLSAWPAPSLASSMGGLGKAFVNRGNRQVALFVLGFAVPFAWMLAAFLPLPERPLDDVEEGPSANVAGQHARELAWRNTRASQLAQLGGVSVVVDQHGRGEVVAHANLSESTGGGSTTIEPGQRDDRPRALDVSIARGDSAAQLQAAFMQSWFSGELEKMELRRRYVKARWWRRLNRVMSAVGVLILGAIVALIVVALKYHL